MRISLPAVAAAALCLCSCIADPSYDLSQLDTEMTVLKGAEFRVPDTPVTTLNDIFDLEGIEYIACNENGDYEIRFGLDPVDMTLYVPVSDVTGEIPVDMDPVEYAFGSIPDFLSGKGQKVSPDLSRMRVNLLVDSEIPADLSIGATIETLKDNAVQHRYDLQDLSVRNGMNDIWLEESSSEPTWCVPDLGKILSPVPDKVRISDVKARWIDGTQQSELDPTHGYGLSLRASFHTPILFSSDSRFTVSIPLDAKLDLEQVGLKKAELIFNYENSIPMDFTVSLYALDADGNRLDNIQVEVWDSLRGRSSGGNGVTLTTQGDLRFDSLVLELTAASNESVAETAFNKNQGIRFYDMKLYLPDGIQIRLDK